jgi:probable phosphoglycerate mutase
VAAVATRLFLVRHSVHALLGRILIGRAPGVPLSDAGRSQARCVAEHLAREGVTAVQSSPRERARETAEIIAERIGVPVQIIPEIDELDVGEWTGRPFAELDTDSRWQRWNAERDTARSPGGESMAEVEDRVMGHLRRLSVPGSAERVALVSHAEIIRTAVLRCLGLPFSAFTRIEIDPATISTFVLGASGPEVLAFNQAVCE